MRQIVLSLVTFFHLAIVYRIQKRGSCTSVSEKECEQYQTLLGVKSYTKQSWSHRVSGCWHWISYAVIFNTDSTSHLCSDEIQCVCNKGKLEVIICQLLTFTYSF